MMGVADVMPELTVLHEEIIACGCQFTGYTRSRQTAKTPVGKSILYTRTGD
jgi:hypothetical protein